MASKLPLILAITALVVGVIAVVAAGVLGWVVIPDIIEDRVEEETRLEEGNDVWEKWVDIPIPIYQDIYFFNLSNPEAFRIRPNLDLGAAVPELKEVGPYSFREIRNKTNIVFGGGDTVYYEQNTRFIFEEKTSGEGLTINDKVNIVNVPLMVSFSSGC